MTTLSTYLRQRVQNIIMKVKNTLIILSVILFAGCGNKKQENDKKAEFKALPFPDVQVPAVISDSQEALKYLAENYWDGLTDPTRESRNDSLYVNGVDKGVVEQKFADWTLILDYVDLQTALKSVGKLYDKAYLCEKTNPSSNIFETFVDLVERYLYDPNSPMRNEEYYLPFVSKYATYEGLSEVMQGKYEREARLCALNRIGTKATDFRFADRYGKIRNLYDIDADYTLLFFSNPGCNACMDIINVLKEEPTISSLIDNGVLSVLNIYIDEDIEAWRSYMPIYPEQWYNGFDPDFVLRSNELYNIRAIPSLYLLDKEKNVLMKDVPENILFNYLVTL